MRRIVLVLLSVVLMLNFFAVRSDDAELQVITAANVKQLRPLMSLSPIPDGVSSVFFNSDGTVLYAGGGEDVPLTAWDIQTRAQLFSIELSYYGFALTADDQFLIVNSKTDLGGITLYDATTGEQKVQIPCSGDSLNVASSPVDSGWFAVYAPSPGGPPSHIDFWEISDSLPNGYTSEAINRCKADVSVEADSTGGSSIDPLIFAPDGKTLLFGSEILDTSNYVITHQFDSADIGLISTAAFSADSHRLALVTQDADYEPHLSVWDTAWADDNQPLAMLNLNPDGLFPDLKIRGLQFSPGGGLLALYGDFYDGKEVSRIVWLWEGKTYEPGIWLKVPYNGSGFVTNLPRQIFSPDGKMIALTDQDTIHLYGVQ